MVNLTITGGPSIMVGVTLRPEDGEIPGGSETAVSAPVYLSAGDAITPPDVLKVRVTFVANTSTHFGASESYHAPIVALALGAGVAGMRAAAELGRGARWRAAALAVAAGLAALVAAAALLVATQGRRPVDARLALGEPGCTFYLRTSLCATETGAGRHRHDGDLPGDGRAALTCYGLLGMRALVLPPADDPVAPLRELRRREAGRLLQTLVRGASGAQAVEVAARVMELRRRDPEATMAALLDPVVAVWLRLGRVDGAAPHLLFELAWRGALGREVTWSPAPAALVSLARDLALALAPGATVTFAAGALVVRAPDRTVALELGDPAPLRALDDPLVRGSAPFPPIAGGVRLALHDENPSSMVEAHPEKSGNALSLGGRPAAEWRDRLAEALALVERHLPALRAEMDLQLQLVLPIGWNAERHLSASYREYVGAAYVTLHPRADVLAEALIHEFQHGKLNLASWHDPILTNPPDLLVRSPVRPDPRPLMGVLLAVHAFVPVAELYRRMLEHDPDANAGAAARLADVVGRNEEGLEVLRQHARPTDAGRRVLDELEALHAQHRALGPIATGVSHA